MQLNVTYLRDIVLATELCYSMKEHAVLDLLMIVRVWQPHLQSVLPLWQQDQTKSMNK